LAALALLLSARGQSRQWLVIACGWVFLAGSALAFYHVGVEQHWWGSVAACGGELSSGVDVTDLAAQLSGPQRRPCDQVDWRLFGLSMAGYNSVVSLGLGVAAIAGGWYLGKETER
jgi:disulfide bond formation protein DsbB